jgi:hypothetical protein
MHNKILLGTQEWGITDSSITETVQVIEFLVSRSVTQNSVFPF